MLFIPEFIQKSCVLWTNTTLTVHFFTHKLLGETDKNVRIHVTCGEIISYHRGVVRLAVNLSCHALDFNRFEPH